MKPWLLLVLTLVYFLSPGHAAEVEFRAIFVAAPVPIQTAPGKVSHQPGLVTTLTPAAQKTLLDDLQKSQPAPEILSLPSVTTALQTKSALVEQREQGATPPDESPDRFHARVECEAQSVTDSHISVILRPQASAPLTLSKREPQVITIPEPSAQPLYLPYAHTDVLILRTLITADLPSGGWALIYLGKIDQENGLPRHFYAFVSATIVK